MPTIIGFIPKTNGLPIFPVGWDGNGNPIQFADQVWPNDCQLLLLDDNNYKENKIVGNNNLALVVQHITTSKGQKAEQLKVLKEIWKWEVSLIDEYSRIERSFRFWQDIKDILDSKNKLEKRKQTINAMAVRYDNAHILQKIDAVAAWYILYISSSSVPNPYEDRFDQNMNKLSKEHEESLWKLIDNKSRFLKKADDIASTLINS